MTTENPDAIRSDIEATRRRLGTNVDAVADKVTPSNIVHRQTNKVRGAFSGAVHNVRERVMGAAEHASGSMHSAGHGAGSAVTGGTHNAGSALSDAGAAIGEVPERITSRAQGNPLAAGLIAFGAGLLASSLVPPSEKEREAAQTLKSKAEPLKAQVTEAARDVAEGLRGPAQEAMENVKATAADATSHVRDEGQTAVSDVRDRASTAKDNVQGS